MPLSESSKCRCYNPTNKTNERTKIENNSLIPATGNIDCGGGIAINGSNSCYFPDYVDADNKTNTYFKF